MFEFMLIRAKEEGEGCEVSNPVGSHSQEKWARALPLQGMHSDRTSAEPRGPRETSCSNFHLFHLFWWPFSLMAAYRISAFAFFLMDARLLFALD